MQLDIIASFLTHNHDEELGANILARNDFGRMSLPRHWHQVGQLGQDTGSLVTSTIVSHTQHDQVSNKNSINNVYYI